MFRPRETTPTGHLSREEYVVDPLAVADAIIKRLRSGRPSKMFESVQSGLDGPVGTDEGQAVTRSDLT